MKKLLIAVAIVAVAGVVQAGDYHQGAGLRCSQCHTMHASRAHQFEAYTDGRSTPQTGYPRTPQDRLLVEAGTNATCLSCHGSGAADVYGIDHTGYADKTRSAGALNGTPGTWTPGSPTYANGNGHTLDSTVAPPGADATVAGNWGGAPFNCADCHEVHGSAYYRNLAPRYGVRTGMAFNVDQSPTYSIGATIDYTVDVTESASEEYDSRNVWFATAGGANRMNAYCGKCHGNFHAASEVVGTEAGTFKRHPTSGAVIGVATTHVPLLVPDQANSEIRPVWQSAGVAEVGCLTCHKAHGNERPFALIYPGNNPTLPASPLDLENGTAPGELRSAGLPAENVRYPIRNLCVNCHPMGRTGALPPG